MNLTDLPGLMDERYESDDVPVLSESRIDGIHRRVTAARRRRTVGTLVVVLAAVAAVGVPSLATRPHRSVPAAASSTVDGFPLWADGGIVIGTQNGRLSTGSVSLLATFSQLDYGFVIESRCALDRPGPDGAVMIAVSVNGTELYQTACGSSQIEPGDPTLLANASLKVGVPATFTLTMVYAQTTATGSPVPTTVGVPDGTISMAVRQRVPFEDYPKPPRPDPLPPFDAAELVREGSASPPFATATSGGDPLAPFTTTVGWPHVPSEQPWLRYDAYSQTPGYLQISVDGTEVHMPAEFWNYSGTSDAAQWSGNISADDLARVGVAVKPGDTITVTVTPHYVSGAWAVAFENAGSR